MGFTGGVSNVFGQVTNGPGGTVVISGGATVTFYDNVVQNGDFEVTTVGGANSAVFLGTVSGSGTITGDGNVYFMGDPVLSGDYSVAAGLVLGADLVISPSAGGSFELSGNVSGKGSLTIDGDGKLVLSGSDTYTGGTTVDMGSSCVTNSAALPAGTILTIGAGGAMDFDPSGAAVPMLASPDLVDAVPEPSVLALLGGGVMAVVICAGRRRKRTVGPQHTSISLTTRVTPSRVDTAC